MDTTKILADLKKRPGFTENVGMVLVHNGVVRGWARADHAPVKSMTAPRWTPSAARWNSSPASSASMPKPWKAN